MLFNRCRHELWHGGKSSNRNRSAVDDVAVDRSRSGLFVNNCGMFVRVYIRTYGHVLTHFTPGRTHVENID